MDKKRWPDNKALGASSVVLEFHKKAWRHETIGCGDLVIQLTILPEEHLASHNEIEQQVYARCEDQSSELEELCSDIHRDVKAFYHGAKVEAVCQLDVLGGRKRRVHVAS